MRMTTALAPLAAALATLAGAEAAMGETLDLVCRVHESRTDGAHRTIRRRLDIDLGRKTVRVSDDVGRGWVFKREYPFLSADRDRIHLESGGGKESYVDRRTGEYFFHNHADGVTMRGACRNSVPERGKF